MKKLYIIFALLSIACIPVTTYAQGFEDDEDVNDQVPLDGGISLLAAGGIAYGVKKWHELKKQNKK